MGHGGFPKLWVLFLGGPYTKDYSICGPILGSPYFGKLPHPETVDARRRRFGRCCSLWGMPLSFGDASTSPGEMLRPAAM